MNVLQKICQHNYIATIYINFRMLPLRQAVRLPIDVYRHVKFLKLTGRIEIKTNNIYRGMIKLGGRGSDMFSGGKLILDIEDGGTWIIHGTTEIGFGSFLRISDNAVFSTGVNVRIGAKNKIYCNKEIIIGDQVDISWESQVFDTNFHFMKNMKDETISSRDGVIKIGSHNWFGNRCNIMKGTITPDNTIVASNSLTNKDYIQTIEPYTLIAGTPAKAVKTNVKRLFEGEDI